tara:strand:- start:649 stop:831 length:183 start_codon:yes stop_codon:yes gene_type:complete
MKVRDLMKSLSTMDPDSEVVLKHLYTSPEVVMKKIRVYPYHGRVYVDGYEREIDGPYKKN